MIPVGYFFVLSGLLFFYGDKHCNKVATGHEPEDSDEEQQSAKDKEISYWYQSQDGRRLCTDVIST